jgi:hypothetical protein
MTLRWPLLSPAVLALVAVGLCCRIPWLGDEARQFHPMLHYENALTARLIWYRMQGGSLPEESRRWADHWNGRIKAPPVVESLTAFIYLLIGVERPWVGELLNVLLWAAGGLLLHLCSLKLSASMSGSLLAMGLFFFHPFGILVSASFQHEPVMVFGFILILWILLSFSSATSRGWKHGLVWGSIAGLCVLLKPGFAYFPVVFAYWALLVQRHGWREALRAPAAYLFPAAALLPSLAYVAYMMDHSETSQLKWHLLGTRMFYQGWLSTLDSAIGWHVVSAGLLGAVIASIHGQWFGLALFCGYWAFACFFPYANMSHDYYLTILLPIVSLQCGVLFAALWKRLPETLRSKEAVSIVFIGLTLAGWSYASLARPLLASRYDVPVEAYRGLGSFLGNGTRVISLNPPPDYGMPLQFHGRVNVQWWPTQIDLWYESLDGKPAISAQARLDALLSRRPAEYFLILDDEEYRRQPDLVRLLEKRYRRLETQDGFLIYDLRPLSAPPANPR